MKKDVMIVTGAGQIGMALARRTGFGKKIILGDKSMKNAETIAEIMNNAGYDVAPFEMDLSSREDILAIIKKALEYGEIKYLINAAGVSPPQAPVEAILKVDKDSPEDKLPGAKFQLLKWNDGTFIVKD